MEQKTLNPKKIADHICFLFSKAHLKEAPCLVVAASTGIWLAYFFERKRQKN
jgi:hypothetical protein